MIDIKLTSDPLSLDDVQTWIGSDGTGGTTIFVGSVRNKTKDKTVIRLDFESFEPMAVKEMRKIADEACAHWPVQRIAIHHRVGSLAIGDLPVIIAVSCAHRAAAFEACRYCIDTLKETVPIWKKEVFDDGEIWVAAHP